MLTQPPTFPPPTINDIAHNALLYAKEATDHRYAQTINYVTPNQLNLRAAHAAKQGIRCPRGLGMNFATAPIVPATNRQYSIALRYSVITAGRTRVVCKVSTPFLDLQSANV